MNTPKFIKLTYKKRANPSPHINNVETMERWFNVNNILVVAEPTCSDKNVNTEILVEGGTYYITETIEEVMALIKETQK